MTSKFDPTENYNLTQAKVGYIEFHKAAPADYAALGFKCGLEIHQQLKTKKKLFCRCPAGIYQKPDDYDAELIRHMRPTLSELGEYDGTALMEFKTRKNITYRIKNVTACTYDIDDTPPFSINREALEIAIEVSLLLKQNIVGELHITRKQYLDGSIPTGFQRTGIIGIEGEFLIGPRKIRLLQLSIEEDSCREISDIGHERIYRTDRLGIPLIETVTYPDMKTPQEVAEAAHYLRFVARSTGKVLIGSGAAREDVNVSITGSQRVEIKGVSSIKRIPRLTHNEAFRHKALILIKEELHNRKVSSASWRVTAKELDYHDLQINHQLIRTAREQRLQLICVNLPGFKGLLSFFTQPGRAFASEISDRLKVIACLDFPNMLYSENAEDDFFNVNHTYLSGLLNVSDDDAQIVFWAKEVDVKTAIETVEERCRLAFDGVPSETRKALLDGTTMFERVLPGPDRMYPDTDSAPISIEESLIERLRENLPSDLAQELTQLREWDVPVDCDAYLLRNNLMPMIRKITAAVKAKPAFVARLFAHQLKNLQGRMKPSAEFSFNKVYGLFKFVAEKGLDQEMVREMLPEVYAHPNYVFDSVLQAVSYSPVPKDELLAFTPVLSEKFNQINTSKDPCAKQRWIMGQLRGKALGNIALGELSRLVNKEVGCD